MRSLASVSVVGVVGLCLLVAGCTSGSEGPEGSAGEHAKCNLAFAQQPSDTTTVSVIKSAVQVEVLDAAGARVTSATEAITITLVGSGNLRGTLTVKAVQGVATFPDLQVTTPGTYRLSASCGVAAIVTSQAFKVSAGPLAKLVVTQSPKTYMGSEPTYQNNQVGQALTHFLPATPKKPGPGLIVELRDEYDNLTPLDGVEVQAWLSKNHVGGTLSGTKALKTKAGVAVFTDLSIDTLCTPDDPYVLGVKAGKLEANSKSFPVFGSLNPPPR